MKNTSLLSEDQKQFITGIAGEVEVRGIKDCPGYWVTQNGFLFSTRYNDGDPKTNIRQLKPWHDSHGYFRITILKKTRKVHRLIATAFIGDAPEGLDYVCHHNGIRDDNRVENLYWGDAQRNADDTIRHGNTTKGEKSTWAKLTQEQVEDMRSRRHRGEKLKDIAALYGVAKSTASMAINGRTWA